jgi:hypothetical protein
VSGWRCASASCCWQRLAGIERDRPRGAPPAKVDAARLVELTTQSQPAAATHWSTRTMRAGVARLAPPLPHALRAHLGIVARQGRALLPPRDITTEPLRRGVFTSVPELEQAIADIAHHNTNPKPFIWTKSGCDAVGFSWDSEKLRIKLRLTNGSRAQVCAACRLRWSAPRDFRKRAGARPRVLKRRSQGP